MLGTVVGDDDSGVDNAPLFLLVGGGRTFISLGRGRFELELLGSSIAVSELAKPLISAGIGPVTFSAFCEISALPATGEPAGPEDEIFGSCRREFAGFELVKYDVSSYIHSIY